MKSEEKSLEVFLSFYSKTTQLFEDFNYPLEYDFENHTLIYEYDVLLLKDFLNVSMKLDGRTKNYSVSLQVERKQTLPNEGECGILMSDLKRNFYKKTFFENTEEDIIQIFINAIRNNEKKFLSHELIPLEETVELYAQSATQRNNPGYFYEYGETNRYFINAIVVDSRGLIWAD